MLTQTNLLKRMRSSSQFPFDPERCRPAWVRFRSAFFCRPQFWLFSRAALFHFPFLSLPFLLSLSPSGIFLTLNYPREINVEPFPSVLTKNVPSYSMSAMEEYRITAVTTKVGSLWSHGDSQRKVGCWLKTLLRMLGIPEFANAMFNKSLEGRTIDCLLFF